MLGQLHDAERLDGASLFRLYWNIVLPIMRPALAALAILTFLDISNVFVWPMLFIRSVEKQTLQIMLSYLDTQINQASVGTASANAWGQVLAASTVATLPLFVLFPAMQRHFIRGIMAGVPKGYMLDLNTETRRRGGMTRERDKDNPLLQYTRDDTRTTSILQVDLEQTGHPGTTYLLGQFLENLAFSIVGGISAQILNNPTCHHKHYLEPKQVEEFVRNGEALLRLYLSGGDPRVLRSHRWISTPLATGFGVCVLDDATRHKLPFGWSPLGYPGSATASAGRIGGAVRLQGGEWPPDPDHRWPVLEDGPAGIRQGVFLPVTRCLGYKGELFVRLGTTNQAEHGEVEVGFRRRVATPDGRRKAGESLAAVRIPCSGDEWQKLEFELELREGQVAFGEPIDFSIRWMPRSSRGLNLLVDRAFLFPQDEDDGLDPEVIALVRGMSMPLLRFPGGNFVSYHHWRDAVGPMDFRPTARNDAWGGLDYNIFGTDEFMTFCRKIG
ncbi:MAG TPA: ABC transporter permease subunit, partial [Herpetosiphonaceae bacterium]|nr:ABC transporter permease subunit [Herpetosiphonaceae bacterium]